MQRYASPQLDVFPSSEACKLTLSDHVIQRIISRVARLAPSRTSLRQFDVPHAPGVRCSDLWWIDFETVYRGHRVGRKRSDHTLRRHPKFSVGSAIERNLCHQVRMPLTLLGRILTQVRRPSDEGQQQSISLTRRFPNNDYQRRTWQSGDIILHQHDRSPLLPHRPLKFSHPSFPLGS